ncbi:AmmeMemoRadiSam system protein B [Desulfovibrio legallii]|uniref:MEMO1 family protein SAMN05192586_102175 n=1 Tax=Desulfovibrio legallii TaxID=571438 RepID=A0A1G7J3J1_9BACT|nr:AmmeMemoRadiSam system protein B [Desulfovibrio legallii]SDF19428.1 hypothetical protein SAMN05192586_102175 [Desulfovibrio legallii]
MPLRQPVAAGRFYPDDPEALRAALRACLTPKELPDPAGARPHGAGSRLVGVMLPHAGYVYSGRVAGAVLAGPWGAGTVGAALPRRCIVLCPNHTGRGHPLGVWPDGAWRTPLGDVPVDAGLAAALCGRGGFAPDTDCHLGEHAIEVLLPFLQYLPAPAANAAPGMSAVSGADAAPPSQARAIVPVCVGVRRPEVLRAAGLALGAALLVAQAEDDPVGLIVSSDMNHYEDQQTTLQKDGLALQQTLACDPDALLTTVEQSRCSMCGAAPMAVALYALRALGEPWAELAAYDTSASATGDAAQVVGYAGLRFGVQ